MTKILAGFLVLKIGNSRGACQWEGWDGKTGVVEKEGEMGYREGDFLVRKAIFSILNER